MERLKIEKQFPGCFDVLASIGTDVVIPDLLADGSILVYLHVYIPI